jgi:hypothetical protein
MRKKPDITERTLRRCLATLKALRDSMEELNCARINNLIKDIESTICCRAHKKGERRVNTETELG